MAIWDSIIGGAASIGSTVIGAEYAKAQLEQEQAWSAKQAELNRSFQSSERLGAERFNRAEREAAQAYNTSEREAAQDWNLEMWNLENEYNDPRAQMDRMVAAGINPNSVAQGMASNGSVAGSVQGSSGQSVSPQSSSGSSGSMASAGSVANTLGDLIGNSVNSMWQNESIRNAIAGQKLDNEMKSKELGIFDERWSLTKDDIRSRIDLAIADAKDKEAAKDLKVQEFEFLKDKNPMELQQMNMIYLQTKAEVDQINQEIENLKKEGNLTDEMIEESRKRQTNIDANTALQEAQTDLTEEEMYVKKVEKAILRKENIIKNVELAAAKQGISFSAPDFWTAYNYEKVTGKRFGDLCSPSRKQMKKDSWIGTGPRVVEGLGRAAGNAGAAYIGGKAMGKNMSGNIMTPTFSGGHVETPNIPVDPYTGQPIYWSGQVRW